jgi:capsular exopolysaccharide synthesis family protein
MVEQRQMAVVNRMVKPSGPRPPVVAAGLTPGEVFGILRRHLLLMVSLTILGLLVGGGIWYLLVEYFPRYTARTYIEVLPPVETDPMTITTPYTQEEMRYSHRVSMATRIKQQRTLQELVGRDVIKDTEWFNNRDGSVRKAIRYLEKYFGAIPQRDGDYVEISMTCRDKEEAALIVNEMAELFLVDKGGTERGDVAERLASLAERRTFIQGELDAAEGALRDVRDRWGLTDLEEHAYADTITRKLTDLEVEQNALVLLIKELEGVIKNLEEMATGPINEQIEHRIEIDPVLVYLARERDLQEAILAGLLTKFGENHRIVRQTQDLIEEIKSKRRERREQIAEQLRQSNLQDGYDRAIELQGRYEELERIRAEAAAAKTDLDLARAQYKERLDVRDERREMLDKVKEQIEKLRVLHDDPKTPKVRLVAYAPVPLEMVNSRRWWFFPPIGTIIGFLLGIGLAFLIEMLNDLVRTPRDVTRHLHIPLLGVIPDAAEDMQARRVDLSHVVRQAPYSIISESYRRLRANFMLSGLGKTSKVLLVSSGSAGDGKTSVAANLATTLVAEDKKVLLIDANFRRPTLHTIFPKVAPEGEVAEQPDFGLSNLLMGQCGPQEAIRPSGLEGFDIIDAGPLPSNPTELIASARMEQLITQQRDNYDYVILDGPPVLLVSDTKVLARLVDATVLVFNAATTRRGAAQRVIRELDEVDAPIAGCVLFAAKSMKGGYFREQFRSYEEYQKMQLARSV